ncbi:MAG: hypothetical protein RIC87_24140 [Kiloniellales bacterium]
MKSLYMLVFVLCLVATSCVNEIGESRTVKAEGLPFTHALTEEYRALVLFEADEMYGWPDAVYFSHKGIWPFQLATMFANRPIDERSLFSIE